MNSSSIESEIISIPPEVSNAPSLLNKSVCDFKLTKKIGEGTFGTVRLGVNIQTGEEVAIKILEKVKILQLEDKTRVEREIKILKCLRHANIVHLYSVLQTDKSIYLIMEYIHGKELFDYIIENGKLNELEACKFYQQIISGIEYLQKLKIVHRDLKPENLLLDTKTKDLKIVDFGLSNIYGTSKNYMLKSACGSPCYAAPEMLNGKEYKAPPIDIWSSGIILYAMLCGYLPFEDENNEELYKKICNGKFSIPSFISEPARDLIKKILTTEPNHRIGIYQIKNHPWFNLLNPNLNINEGLLINQMVIPLDEGVISDMINKYGFMDKEKIRACILSNRHNDIATIYYLLLRKKTRQGKKSVADLKSNIFLQYIKSRDNLFENYGFDFDKVIECRKEGIVKEREKKTIKKNRRDIRSCDSVSTNPSEKISPNNQITRKKANTTSPIEKRNKQIVALKSNSNFRKNTNNIGTLKGFKQVKHKAIFINTKKLNGIKPLRNNSNASKHKIVSPITRHTITLSLNENESKQAGKKQKEFCKLKTSTSPNVENNLSSALTSIMEKSSPHIKPYDLSCISFKTKRQIKESILLALEKLKIKSRSPKGKIVIETFKENFKMEISIVELNQNGYYLKFKRILGNLMTYSTLSRRILKRVEL